MGKKGGHLKSALQSQQSRLKNKQKLEQAAQAAQVKAKKQHRQQEQAALASTSKASLSKAISSHTQPNAKGKGKEKHVQPTQRPIIPFKPTDKILLVGEGNFSFTRALVFHPPTPALASLPPGNVTATAYDKEEECYEKYADAKEIVRELRERGVRVVFGVDATKLERSKELRGGRWDRVVFNFPHAGKGIADQDRNILSNQLLLLNFLASASKVLVDGPIPSAFGKKKRKKKGEEDEESEPEVSEGEGEDEDMVEEGPKARGTVLVTLRNVVPYTQWDLPRLAKNPPPPQTASAPPYPRYVLLRSFKFHRNIWQGYIHRMTKGERVGGTGKTGEGGEDRTWEFYLPDPKLEY